MAWRAAAQERTEVAVTRGSQLGDGGGGRGDVGVNGEMRSLSTGSNHSFTNDLMAAECADGVLVDGSGRARD